MLLDKAGIIEEIKKLNYDQIKVEAFSQNLQSQKIYEKMGFKPIRLEMMKEIN